VSGARLRLCRASFVSRVFRDVSCSSLPQDVIKTGVTGGQTVVEGGALSKLTYVEEPSGNRPCLNLASVILDGRKCLLNTLFNALRGVETHITGCLIGLHRFIVTLKLT
jgi:hypothetical protein